MGTSTIINGRNTQISAGSPYSPSNHNAIGAAQFGNISPTSTGNVILGGFYPCIQVGYYTSMGSAQSSCIQSSTSYSTIAGGRNNTICTARLMVSVIGSYRTASANYTTYAEGVNKGGGTFGIVHPDPSKKATRNLYHSFVEAPTEGENIYRYKIETCNCTATLDLPSYYKFLNKNDHVSVTASNHFGSAYGIIDNTQSFVTFTSDTDGQYDVLIIGTRKDRDVNGYGGVERYKHGVNNDFIC